MQFIDILAITGGATTLILAGTTFYYRARYLLAKEEAKAKDVALFQERLNSKMLVEQLKSTRDTLQRIQEINREKYEQDINKLRKDTSSLSGESLASALRKALGGGSDSNGD